MLRCVRQKNYDMEMVSGHNGYIDTLKQQIKDKIWIGS